MSTGKTARLLDVTVTTLQRWERDSRLIPYTCADSKRRLCAESRAREFLRLRRNEREPSRIMAYCCVSNADQQLDRVNQR